MVAPEPGGRADAVEERHVEVDDDGIGVEVFRELDCLETVGRRSDDRQLGLPVD